VPIRADEHPIIGSVVRAVIAAMADVWCVDGQQRLEFEAQLTASAWRNPGGASNRLS